MNDVGRRLREIRSWRKMTMIEVAGLAGISQSQLSRLETGEKPLDSRKVIEGLATALRVSPAALLSTPMPPGEPVSAEMRAGLADLQAALTDNALFSPWSPTHRPWPQLRAELDRLQGELRPACDYPAQLRVLPALIGELHAIAVVEPQHRKPALEGLMHCYCASAAVSKQLHGTGLPQLAVVQGRRVAEELESPEWLAAISWYQASGLAGQSTARRRMLDIALRAATAVERDSSSVEGRQMAGMHHLYASLSAAALGRGDDAASHLAEAAQLADAQGDTAVDFAWLHFGTPNLGVWRMSVAVELGETGQVIELARKVDPTAIGAAARQAMYHAEIGRALARDRRTREQAVIALRRAEEVAPHMIRPNALVRETVADLLRKARRDAGGRELRGMAHRMGIAA